MSRIEKIIEQATKIREGAVHDSEQDYKKGYEYSAPSMSVNEPLSDPIMVNNPYLVTLTDSESPACEEYRKLKSMVVRLTKNNHGNQNVIMVTSAIPNEGKTITALNLSVSLAQEYDSTVLLVDADLRQPAIHKYLGIDAKRGLSNCLSNGTDVGDVLIKTGIGKLMVLPAGSSVTDPVELLMSKKMRDLVKEMKHRYADRYIIFDTPPLLPFAEAHTLSSLMDGVIFVVRERYAPLSSIKEAVNLIKHSNVLGIVYNAAEIAQFDGYGRYYGKYHKKYNKRAGHEKS